MKKIFMMSVFALVLSLVFTSCKPYQKPVYVEVGANETAYVIPMETGNKAGQTKMKSEAYLEQNKVATQRIYVPTQWIKTGRGPGSGKWIESVKVIKVDRTPVTREWNSTGGGTNKNSNEALEVESKESIGFSVCITCTASIPEQSSSLFLYSYSGKTLAQVMDLDVRGYIQNVLTTEFGNRSLTMCQNERTNVFNNMRKDVTAHFAKFGIQIVNVGSAGGFVYQDNKIQEAINDKYASEMKITTVKNESEAANKFAQSKESITAQKMLDADIAIKLAFAKSIESGKLPVPSTVAGNINLMELYGLKGVASKK